MNTKRIICALMCAILLCTAVVPAYATSDYHRVVNSDLGVRITCTSFLYSDRAKSNLVLSFVSGVSHQPMSSYSARAEAYAIYSTGMVLEFAVGNMSAVAIAQPADGKTVTSSAHNYLVNGTQVYYKELT